MKVLVTGGAGFIGSHVVDELVDEGNSVVVIDKLFSGKKENLNKKAEFYKVDIRSFNLAEIFKKEKPEAVFHFAAKIILRESVEDPIGDANTNVLGSLNILENCRKFNVGKIVFASTGGAIYGNAKIIPTCEDYPCSPLYPYGIAKLTVEKYLDYYYKVFRIGYVALRYGNVFGPRQYARGEAGVVAIFCGQIFSGKRPVIFGTGKQTRDFVYVKDAARAAILALQSQKTGVFNIGTGKEISINEVFATIKNITRSGLEPLRVDPKKGEQKRSCLDPSKANKELGWVPSYSFDEGISETVDWLRRNQR